MVEGGQPERLRHYWILRGVGWQEAMDGANFVGAARSWSICVRAAKEYK